MIVVIQCAASKRADAGFLQTGSGTKVLFVADPTKAPRTEEYIYARPDDPADDGESWRDKLLRYNETHGNPLRLSRAFELYKNDTYRQLVGKFGVERTFILSAGWGLIGAAFLTPYYDITFSQAVKKKAPHKFRHQRDRYRDLCQLPKDGDEPVVFFGGNDYVPLFCNLTRSYSGKRVVFYNSTSPPDAPNCLCERFDTRTRTNWHYECAQYFLAA